MNSDDVCLWQEAYNWLCRSRIKAAHNADIWDLRFKWPDEGNFIFSQVNTGEYRLSPVKVIHSRSGEFYNGMVCAGCSGTEMGSAEIKRTIAGSGCVCSHSRTARWQNITGINGAGYLIRGPICIQDRHTWILPKH